MCLIFIGCCGGFFKKCCGERMRNTRDCDCCGDVCRDVCSCIGGFGSGICERTDSCLSECSRPCDNILDSCAKCRRDPGNNAVPAVVVSQEPSSFSDS